MQASNKSQNSLSGYVNASNVLETGSDSDNASVSVHLLPLLAHTYKRRPIMLICGSFLILPIVSILVSSKTHPSECHNLSTAINRRREDQSVDTSLK